MSDSPDAPARRLAETPPSTRLVFKTLLHEGDQGMTREELQAATQLGERTVRRALNCLQDEELVDHRPDPDHPRRQIWYQIWTD